MLADALLALCCVTLCGTVRYCVVLHAVIRAYILEEVLCPLLSKVRSLPLDHEPRPTGS
jgi:hypothetical protein